MLLTTATRRRLASTQMPFRRSESRRHLLQDALLAAVVVAAALAQLVVPVHVFVTPGTGALVVAFVAITLRRTWVAGSLGLLVVLGGLESYVYADRLSPLALAYMIVLATAAARGSRPVVVLAGLGAAFGGFYAAWDLSFGGGRYAQLLNEPTELQAVALFAPALVLVSAWLVGLLVRLRRTTRIETALREGAQVSAERSGEAARSERLRAEMARDVHDVVGHALTVVIAQADAAAFVDDVDRLHAMAATIGAAARSSMAEIRDVLDDTDDTVRSTNDHGAVEALVDEARAAGIDVRRTAEGSPVPVPARSALVIRRVVQEMLTNAVRHGAPETPVLLREHWSATTLSIETENQIAAAPSDGGGGRGIVGMQNRLAAISGDLAVDRGDDVFRVRAQIPLVQAQNPLATTPGGPE
ncbi:sensor histidine kinase [Curtobacterium herbarum]|nr:histidine kinase [Curtobacterium herbarum]MBM7475386.1 signal transduction histidine kinase [Curtobacterium herbarum]MCS6543302.1 histidine kinase [Curtobacterium herbarum]